MCVHSQTLLLCSALLCSSFTDAHKESAKTPEFVIVVLSYNNEKFVRRNIESLLNQKTSVPYSIIYVNDCSQDNTGAIIDEYAKRNKHLKVIHNAQRKGAMANMYTTIHEHCNDHQVVVLCDGDDCLAHNKVLKRLEEEYADPNLWLTYGQFIFYPSGNWGTTYEIPRTALEKKEVRSLVYVAQHLRTFKAALFKKIKKEDLMLNGEFYSVNADMATMIPMIEMAAPLDAHSPCHSKFIPDILYIYNYDNPIGDERINRPQQLSLEKVIRGIKPYDPLATLSSDKEKHA